jgi:hypothetical protein
VPGALRCVQRAPYGFDAALRRGGRLGVAAALLAVLASRGLTASGLETAQGPTTSELKAAFLYNFLRFTEWPRDVVPAGAAIFACIAGDDAVADGFDVIVGSRRADAGAIVVRRLQLDGDFTNCQVVYLGNVDMKRAAATVDILRRTPVLTVSDLHGFAHAGGMVELLQENDKMRFAINPKTAERARIRLSSRLLSLATIIKD